MKYVVILGDGMADYPIPELQNKTPLMVAKKPNIDNLVKKGELGLFKTVPDGMKPGSDVANLSVLGYNPEVGYTGRSPLEACSIGIDILDTDVTVRTNLVTLSNEQNFEDKKLLDYSAGEISTEEARELIEYLGKHIGSDKYKFYAGISYRHCLVVDHGTICDKCTPPHDISGRVIGQYLPKGEVGEKYLELMKKSHELLKNHPINLERVKNGKNPANCVWFWGEGTKPALSNFEQTYFVKGAMISAVDLLKGMALATGMKVVEVEGATGNYDTNYLGKANACLDTLKNGVDLVYVHVEAPDECGHHGDLDLKIKSIEQIDEKIVGTILKGLKESGEDFAMLIAPDHPTPVSTMTHAKDPVPYLLYRSDKNLFNGANSFDEEQAKNTGVYESNGYKLMKKLIKGE